MFTLLATSCGSSDDQVPGAPSTGGAPAVGGAGGQATGGIPGGTGGSTASSGGSTRAGGGPGAGGVSAGGVGSGGGSPLTGGASSQGGTIGSGGAPVTGGAGPASGGASGSGGSPATGGMAATGGTGGDQNCALPTSFKWTSGGPLASPKNGWVSIKDFSHVFHDNQHIIYMTTYGTAWGSAMMVFDDWPNAASVPQTKTASGVAPTLFYFTPKKLWVLAYQWGPHKFSYRTSTDPKNPGSWSAAQALYNTALPSTGTGPIDQTVICNATKCYLYYAGDNGHIYKSSMPLGNFPGLFPGAQDSGIQGTTQNLFEAVQVYAVKGSNRYLMIVEAQGSARYFRAWTATDLEGPWTLLTDNFAIKSNVTFTTNWTNDISHGDLVRINADETFTIDPCNLQLVFQGRDPNFRGDYALIPYKLGLLTLAK